ncbi:hypothetical protein H257_13177 [Aphanomyces astaci]|uniref:Uncharacterized protein n=1 Tax=Aphanomyces astaci TaxID=112090 RepID=W4FXJ8_APHAT|nr:hypothetical protein H257_13177 [Aphanomyces astaci]ETV71514.1 hypothetical protein H257_13177 [Aphanomyces astaci]|eukprot:XP_009838947.1 hypothetical protein H257_13177 [Aphanomyces astaci]
MPQQTNMSPKVASTVVPRVRGKKHLTLAQRHRIYELLHNSFSVIRGPSPVSGAVAVHPHAMAGVLPISRQKLQETLVAKERVLRTRLKPQSAKPPRIAANDAGTGVQVWYPSSHDWTLYARDWTFEGTIKLH